MALALLTGSAIASPAPLAQYQYSPNGPQGASPHGQPQQSSRPQGPPFGQAQPPPYGQAQPPYKPQQPGNPPPQANTYTARPPKAAPYSPSAPTPAVSVPGNSRTESAKYGAPGPAPPSSRPANQAPPVASSSRSPRPDRPTNQAPPPASSSRGPRPGRPTNQAPPPASYSRGQTQPGRPTSSRPGPSAPSNAPPPANPTPGAPQTPTNPPPNAPPPQADGCPAVWTQISQDLTKMFVGADGQCTDSARQAIRAVFHDCGTWNTAQGNTGGCDGSLILSPEENAKTENRGLQDISSKLQALATQRQVGVADMLAYAGSHATVSCPLGPTVPIKIGRTDSNKAANEALLPGNATLSADTILSLFADKGFSPPEVSALVGAHSTSKQFFANPAKAGQSQDSTPGVWDVKYYSETTAQPPNPNLAIFPSDMNLAVDPRSGPAFKSFVNAQG
ncbi:heme peroxidase [Tothia fuscella]|uniref:Peroxidase n=1 Tax=Tothia fuscella TaxID=1048955 RepID=A0A9P4NV84_9PEZI|nr:heme peroxidase [Tothia fuscella]